jgi:hypothetical protein
MAKFLYNGQIVEGVLLDEQDDKTYNELLVSFGQMPTYTAISFRREAAIMLLSEYDITKKCVPEFPNDLDGDVDMNGLPL